MKKILIFICFFAYILFSKAQETPIPFKIFVKDRSIQIPNSILSKIDTSRIVVCLIIDNNVKIKDYKIFKFYLKSSSCNINYMAESLFSENRKLYPKEMKQFMFFIENKIKTIKVVKNKYAVLYKKNHGFVTFYLTVKKP